VHMIIVTWIETRAWLREYGKPIAALWRAEADQEQYEYACEYVSRSGYRLHTFPPHTQARQSSARSDHFPSQAHHGGNEQMFGAK
jgi:hypothetical protein